MHGGENYHHVPATQEMATKRFGDDGERGGEGPLGGAYSFVGRLKCVPGIRLNHACPVRRSID